MTTICAIKTKKSIIIGADTQVTTGHLKLPFPDDKILQVGNTLIASTGGVGDLQNLLKIASKQIYVNRIIAEDFNFDISPSQLSRELSELTFSLKLEYKNYSPFGYLIAGIENNLKHNLISVCSDASVIEIPTYWSDGSGMELALSCLGQHFYPEITDEEAIDLVFKAIQQSNKSDIYTNHLIQVYLINANDGIKVCACPKPRLKF